jgi:hypothetical protein
MPRRIKQLATPFTGGRSRGATPAAEEHAAQGAAAARTAGDERLALADALPAEAAPGRDVVPVSQQRAPVQPPLPRPSPPAAGRAYAQPPQEPPWTSVPSAEPSSVDSRPSAGGSRGLPAAPERSLESA